MHWLRGLGQVSRLTPCWTDWNDSTEPTEPYYEELAAPLQPDIVIHKLEELLEVFLP